MADAVRRWLVAFASRRQQEIPDVSSIDATEWEPPALEAARLVWRRRLTNEALSVELARRLRETSARAWEDDALQRALERLEQDERSHVELARAVLRRIDNAGPPAAGAMELGTEPAEQQLTRLVLTGLCVCETVSAARFAAVREHTDLPVFRACIDVFLRDELAHGELGLVLLPDVLDRLVAAAGRERADALVRAELQGTLGELDRVVGLDLERQGDLPSPRPQPTMNPGVVEPAIDALAFYRAIRGEILPRLTALGIPAAEAWARRGTR